MIFGSCKTFPPHLDSWITYAASQTVGQAFCMALLAAMTYLAAKPDALPFPGHGNTAAGLVAAVLLFVSNSFFAIGWLGIPFLVCVPR